MLLERTQSPSSAAEVSLGAYHYRQFRRSQILYLNKSLPLLLLRL